jgi:hypothetical protein
MALMDLIEYVDEQSAEMAHRVPPQGSGEFKIGAQLIVRESQWASAMARRTMCSTLAGTRYPPRTSPF